jgi:hypothetical protein
MGEVCDFLSTWRRGNEYYLVFFVLRLPSSTALALVGTTNFHYRTKVFNPDDRFTGSPNWKSYWNLLLERISSSVQAGNVRDVSLPLNISLDLRPSSTGPRIKDTHQFAIIH